MVAIRNIHLTKKEIEVLELVKRGFNTREIAAQLNISVNTVGNHRASLVKKLGLKGSNSLLKYIVECTVESGVTIII